MEWNLIDLSPRCPEAKQTASYSVVMCNLNDRRCLLGTDGYCPTYEDWLFERRQEELDQVGKEEGMEVYGYKGCKIGANILVFSRKQDKVVKACFEHAERIVEETSPEYVESCPYCGCLIPVN